MGELVTVGETPLKLVPPDRQQFISSDTLEMAAAGTESNVAIAASAMGTDSTWLSKLPETQLGKRIVNELREYGVETDIIWSEDGRVGLEFNQRGSPPRDDTVIHDREGATAASMTPFELPMDRVREAEAVFTSGSTAALSDSALDSLESVLRASSNSEGLTIFDIDYRSSLWSPETALDSMGDLFDNVDVLIANEDQLRTLTGRTGDPREVAHGVASQWDIDIMAMTRSEYGAIAIEKSTLHERESVETDPVNPAGQHQAFCGAFIRELMDDTGTGEALTYGVAAAALSRTIPSPLPIIEEEDVERLVEQI